ncbi:NACHT domain-containing protein [Kribbella sp. NBC_00359]|uniref:NACHT domain-containing protein n=1 Tax=Kribbella sp. NBC_00359 TaxID=2975966 RepID=UPI002E1C8D41
MEFPVIDDPPARHPDPNRTPWEGMSGAAVFASGHLVGVVGQHHRGEGLGTLTVRLLQLPPNNDLDLPTDAVRTWADALPQLREELPVVTPPTTRKLAASRAQVLVTPLAPRVLVGRENDLDRLAHFSVSPDQSWRWIQAEAFAGKSALLATFALHPPETVDVAACFLQATMANNTASYALDVLNSQLAVLAGRDNYASPAEIWDRIPDLLSDLLPAAAAVARQQARRLLIIVDGLDEYSREETSPLSSWLPSTLPAGVALLVSSRAGIPIPLAAAHPLSAHIDGLAPSAAAIEIRSLAIQELDGALERTDELQHQIAACLAACGGTISTDDLGIWLERRNGAQDSVLPEYLTSQARRWLHRTIRISKDSDQPGAEILTFTHETLRDAAEARFATTIAAFRRELHSWADDYRKRGWPTDTPPYLLTGYPALLTRLHDSARMAVLALDARRHHQQLVLTDGDANALNEIRAAQSLLLSSDEPDLATIGRLARHRGSDLRPQPFHAHRPTRRLGCTWPTEPRHRNGTGHPRRRSTGLGDDRVDRRAGCCRGPPAGAAARR